ncbi:MAG: hypothetical protein ABIQ31_11835 [Ferruginibacter sp.]
MRSIIEFATFVWKEFGEDNFAFEILSEIGQNDSDKADYSKDVKELENMFIEELQPSGDKGYSSFNLSMLKNGCRYCITKRSVAS